MQLLIKLTQLGIKEMIGNEQFEVINLYLTSLFSITQIWDHFQRFLLIQAVSVFILSFIIRADCCVRKLVKKKKKHCLAISSSISNEMSFKENRGYLPFFHSWQRWLKFSLQKYSWGSKSCAHKHSIQAGWLLKYTVQKF